MESVGAAQMTPVPVSDDPLREESAAIRGGGPLRSGMRTDVRRRDGGKLAVQGWATQWERANMNTCKPAGDRCVMKEVDAVVYQGGSLGSWLPYVLSSPAKPIASRGRTSRTSVYCNGGCITCIGLTTIGTEEVREGGRIMKWMTMAMTFGRAYARAKL